MFKRGAHTTISSDGLQNELVIGRVCVLGNLGREKNNPESTWEGDLSPGTRLSRARRKPTNHQNVKPVGSGSGALRNRDVARVQVLGRNPSTHS